jgi:hypothetical protein
MRKGLDQNTFDTLKIEMIDFVNSTDIGENKVNLAVVTVSERLRLIHNMNGIVIDRSLIANRINNLELPKKNARNGLIETSFEFAKFLFEQKNRVKIVKAAVLASTGKFESNFASIRKAANSLKNACHVLALDIGKQNTINLKLVVSSPDYFLKSFKELKEKIHNLMKSTCST